MRILTTYVLTFAILAGQGLAVAGSSPVEKPYQLKNVELSAEGQLAGQCITSAGLPVADADITLQMDGRQTTIATDGSGKFVVDNLTGGRCVITFGEESYACRLWQNGTAPPNAIKSVAVVASKGAQVRGNILWPPPYIPVPARLAAISGKQALGLGLIIAGATVGIVAATDDDDAS